jgi:hypothetical protein
LTCEFKHKTYLGIPSQYPGFYYLCTQTWSRNTSQRAWLRPGCCASSTNTFMVGSSWEFDSEEKNLKSYFPEKAISSHNRTIPRFTTSTRNPRSPGILMPPTSLSLKQRLAALSQAPSSPTSPQPLRSPLGRRRSLFNPPWVKRQNAPVVCEEREAQELVQEVMSRTIFQAGVDFECVFFFFPGYVLVNGVLDTRTRPMCVQLFLNLKEMIYYQDRVVLNASALPDPREVSYDLLLSYVTCSPLRLLSDYFHKADPGLSQSIRCVDTYLLILF